MDANPYPHPRERTACFAGHRRLPEPLIRPLRIALARRIGEYARRGIDHFLCGGAVGFDQLAGFAALDAMAEHPRIRLHLILPCANQDERWPSEAKRRYADLIRLASDARVLSERYYEGCMLERNRYLIANSARVIAYRSRAHSGTGHTLKLAEREGLAIENLYGLSPAELLQEGFEIE